MAAHRSTGRDFAFVVLAVLAASFVAASKRQSFTWQSCGDGRYVASSHMVSKFDSHEGREEEAASIADKHVAGFERAVKRLM